jgi:AcrR family transcriptional regulator
MDTQTDPRIERSRAAVLDASVALLLEGGLSAVTVDAVSGRSGVAKTTIYRHWENRDALVLDTFQACLPTVDMPDARLPYEEALRELMRSATLAIAKPRFRSALPHILAAKQEVDDLAEMQQRIDQEQYAALKAVLMRGISEGRLPVDTDLNEAKHQLFGPLISMALSPEIALDEAAADRVVDLFLTSRTA